MTELTKHLPLIAYEGSILSALGRGLTIADAHHHLSPADGAAVIAEIVLRVNMHDELVEALRDVTEAYRIEIDSEWCGTGSYTAMMSKADKALAILAKVDAAKGG